MHIDKPPYKCLRTQKILPAGEASSRGGTAAGVAVREDQRRSASCGSSFSCELRADTASEHQSRQGLPVNHPMSFKDARHHLKDAVFVISESIPQSRAACSSSDSAMLLRTSWADG